MVEEDKNGQKPLFRDRLWNFEERMVKIQYTQAY